MRRSVVSLGNTPKAGFPRPETLSLRCSVEEDYNRVEVSVVLWPSGALHSFYCIFSVVLGAASDPRGQSSA